MKKCLPLLGLLALAEFAAAALKDAPAVNADQVLREIEAMEKTRREAMDREHLSAMETLRSGLASPGAAASLYARAVEATRFEGRSDKVPAFLDWKKKNAELLRSSEFAGAARFHLRYLMLSLERAASDKPQDFASHSLAYASELAPFLLGLDKAGRQPGELRELLDKPVSESVFARWLRLGPRLPAGGEWEPAAGNLAGILEKNVRAPLRAAADPRLLEAYDLQLSFEAGRVGGGGLEHEAREYNTVRRPRLQFQRAGDLVVLGLNNRAVQEILALMRAYPQHPDFPRWADRARGLLAPPAPEKPLEQSAGPQ